MLHDTTNPLERQNPALNVTIFSLKNSFIVLNIRNISTWRLFCIRNPYPEIHEINISGRRYYSLPKCVVIFSRSKDEEFFTLLLHIITQYDNFGIVFSCAEVENSFEKQSNFDRFSPCSCVPVGMSWHLQSMFPLSPKYTISN